MSKKLFVTFVYPLLDFVNTWFLKIQFVFLYYVSYFLL